MTGTKKPVSAAAAKAAVAEPVPAGMERMVATAHGYFNWLIQPGEVFDVPKGTKGAWFKPHKPKPDDEAVGVI